MENIYEFIDKVKIKNDDDFLNFVKVLTNYFAKQLGVENCKVGCNLELKKQDLNKSAFENHLTPAQCGPIVQNGKLVGCSIVFDPSLAKQGRIARIIKLTAHEWMHYYDNLVKAGIVKIEDVDIKYQDLIVKSHKFVAHQMRKEIVDRKLYDCLLKLSPSESLADLYAQNLLKDILKHSKNEALKIDIQKQIDIYEQQIVEHKQYLKEHNFEGYDYNNLQRWRNN